MKPSQKVEKLDNELITLLVVITVGISKFVEHTIKLIAEFVTITAGGVDITMWALYGIVATVFITLWFLE